MTAMVNLRVFLSERLSSAALEISEEVEKVLSVYQAEVSRSREEIRFLQKQLELQLRHLQKDHPYINNGVVHGEEASFSPRLVNVATAIKREEGSTISTMDYEDSDHSRANVDSAPSNAEIQADVPTIKEEQQEVLCIDGEGCGTTTNTTAPFANRDPEQSDTGFGATYETPDFISTCPSAVSADLQEAWSQRTQKARESAAAVQREGDGSGWSQGTPPPPPAPVSSFARTQNSDHSFCHLCGKPFRYIGSLMKHIKMHDDHTVACGICSRSCLNVNDLLGHLRAAHRGSFFCHICGKTFSKQCFLIIHSKQHKGSKQFACDDWQPCSRKGAS